MALPEEPDTSPTPRGKAAPLVFTADVRSGEAAAERRRGGKRGRGSAGSCGHRCLCLGSSRTCAHGEVPGSAAQHRRLSRDELLLRSTGGTAASLGDALAWHRHGEAPVSCKALQKDRRCWGSGGDWPDPGLISMMSSVLLPLGCVAQACEGGFWEVGMESMRRGAWVQLAAGTWRELRGQP